MSVTFSYFLDALWPVFTIGEPVAYVATMLAAKGLECAPVLDDGKYMGMVFLSGLAR